MKVKRSGGVCSSQHLFEDVEIREMLESHLTERQSILLLNAGGYGLSKSHSSEGVPA